MNTKLKKLFRSLMITSAFCILHSALPAKANDQMQGDTNTLAAFSTNTFRLYNDVTGTFTNGQATSVAPYIYCTKGADAWIEVGGIFTNSGAGPSNVTYRIAGSVSGSQWTNNYASVTLAVPVGTNYQSAILFLQHPPPFIGWRSFENPNTGNVSTRTGTGYLKAYIKDGI